MIPAPDDDLILPEPEPSWGSVLYPDGLLPGPGCEETSEDAPTEPLRWLAIPIEHVERVASRREARWV